MSEGFPTLYRVYDTIGPGGLTLHWQEFTVISETPLCWYVLQSDRLSLSLRPADDPELKRQRKRVLKEQSGKRYCYSDKRLALDSYRCRKEWQKSHARLSAARGEAGAEAAKALLADSGAPVLPMTQSNEYIQHLGWEDGSDVDYDY